MGVKYLLFAGDAYYPQGGWDDFVSAFGTLEECTAAVLLNERNDWAQVVEIGMLSVVREFSCVREYEPKDGNQYGVLRRRWTADGKPIMEWQTTDLNALRLALTGATT